MANYYNPNTLAKFREALREAIDDVKNAKNLHVTISEGNIKMGHVASVSLLPFLSCPGTCGDTCGAKCYAAKLANLRKNVLTSYARNQAIATLRPDIYWSSVDLAMKQVKWFRFHVSGDVLNYNYFDKMIEACRNNPTTKVLVFTKKFDIVNKWIDENGTLPENLSIMFSGWSNLIPTNPHKLPETNVVEKGYHPRSGWTMCGGNCFECALNGVGCWTAKSGDVIAFNEHYLSKRS